MSCELPDDFKSEFPIQERVSPHLTYNPDEYLIRISKWFVNTDMPLRGIEGTIVREDDPKVLNIPIVRERRLWYVCQNPVNPLFSQVTPHSSEYDPIS